MEIKQSRIGIDNQKFTFEGVTHLTLNFESDATNYPLFYEPILVSNQMKSNILGAKPEFRSDSCTRDFEQQTGFNRVQRSQQLLEWIFYTLSN